uniref:Delta-6 fatty acid desaturase n=1 Tax=Globisporangium splendens TaxID=82926 RepID=L7TAM6_GLOSP|nr:delta-6 fatty acid desaturase [Globisporangium splendens]
MVDLKPGIKRIITWKEIREHATPATAWIVIHHKVYDISKWDSHPGGTVMLTQAGEDATDAFAVFHPSSALKLLEQFYIGDVDETSRAEIEAEPTSDEDRARKERINEFIASYRRLRVKVKGMGLHDASTLYYAWKIISTFGIAVLSMAICYFSNHFALYMVAGAIMGLFYQQSGWLAHDFLHNQVCKNRTLGNLIGCVVGDVWQGFSVQWWKNKHNLHHAVPNLHSAKEDGFTGDPDIDTMPLLAWSKEMARKAFESAHGPFFIRNQAYLYFPLLLLARLSWLAQSFFYVFTEFSFGHFDPVEFKKSEQVGLIIHYMWQLAIPYYCSMSFFEGVCYFLMGQASCGLLLALVFSLGHNGMSVYERETKPDFWQLQVTTTRNITPSLFMDWFTGGLNYQIDHHLFPLVPRHNLPKVNVLIKSLCKEFDIPFHETGFWQGIYEVVDHLADISKEFITEFPAM